MKKTFNLLTLSIIAFFAMGMLIASCTGPEGPAGADGTDGTDGVDANSWCIQCHTLDNKNTIEAQFAMSSHGPLNGSYARGASKTCAKCHAVQGYMETIQTGRDTTAAVVPIPMYFDCNMCHDFHGTLEETEFPDYALRNTAPVSLMYNGHQSSIDLAGSGNLCGYCHQPRRQAGFPLEFNGTDSIAVTSSHWGTHYGTATVLLSGTNGFEVPGTMAYESSAHTAALGCSDCHMVKNETRTDVGGHTFKMAAEDGYQNMAACTDCHSGETTFNINGVQDEIHELLDELHHLLMDLKMLDDTGHAIPYTAANGLGRKFTENEAGAMFNYFLVHYEGSYGVHNYDYTKALLVNTIDMVKNW